MKILVIHQFYLLPGQPGSSRFNEMTRLWSEAGHEVTVIAGTLNYATGGGGERYRGRWITQEQDGNVHVWRCHVARSYVRGYGGRMWAFAAFTLSAATAALRVPRPDVVIASSPPLVAALPGWVAARWRLKKVPWVFEVRDLWPESAVTTGVLNRGSLFTRLLFWIERWACRAADVVAVLTPAFSEDLVSRGLKAADRIVLMPNGADLRLFRPDARDNDVRRQLGWGDKIVALYAGAHGRANALGQIVDAAVRLRHRDDLLIATVGDGPERNKWQKEAERLNLTNLVFLGPRPKDQMPALVAAADIGLAVLQHNPTFRTVYPNKIFDYMACGLPVVIAIDGVARALVCDQVQCGVFVEPEDGAALALALQHLADNPALREQMGRCGRTWTVAHGSREAIASRYADVLFALSASNSTKHVA